MRQQSIKWFLTMNFRRQGRNRQYSLSQQISMLKTANFRLEKKFFHARVFSHLLDLPSFPIAISFPGNNGQFNTFFHIMAFNLSPLLNSPVDDKIHLLDAECFRVLW